MQYRKMMIQVVLVVGAALALAFTVQAARTPAAPAADLAAGNSGLKSAGALAFGPDGVLFVGDSAGGAIAAIDTADRTPRFWKSRRAGDRREGCGDGRRQRG